MAKRQLTRRQNWRIDKVQEERAARAAKRESRMLEELEGGDLGPEQTGLVIAHFGVQVEVEALEGELAGQVQRCHLRANLPTLVTGDRVVWRPGNQGNGVIVAQLPRTSELCRPDMRGVLKPVAGNVDLIVIGSPEDRVRIRALLRLKSGNRRKTNTEGPNSVERGVHRRKAPAPVRVCFAGDGARAERCLPGRPN